MTDVGTVGRAGLNDAAIGEALRRAAASAQQVYLRAGLSMPVWRGGRLTWLNARDVERSTQKT